jgi:centrosomal protein CEP135
VWCVQVERERGELEVKSRSLEKQVRLVTDDLTQKSVRLETTMDDANQQKANAAQMRMLAEHAETSLQDAQQQLARKEALLRQQEEKGVRLEQRVAELESLMKKDLEQISRLRATVGALDGDKDSLQMAVDEKTEKVVALNDELGRKVGDR